MHETQTQPVVLITGASAGLGLAIARALLDARKYRLILTARRESLTRFEECGVRESENLWLRPLDVTSDSERRAVIDEAQAKWGGVDVLINNAGISYRAVVEHVTEEERLAQMDINYRSPMELTRLVLPGMRAKRMGRIINISSVGGMMAMPTMAVYSASKFALEGATESLWYEVRPWNIFVTLVEPGFINSRGFEKVQYTDKSALSATDWNDGYVNHYRSMNAFISKIMTRAFATPESVAKKVVHVIEQRSPPLRAPATLDAWLFSFLRRLLPRRFYHAVLYRALPGVKEWGA